MEKNSTKQPLLDWGKMTAVKSQRKEELAWNEKPKFGRTLAEETFKSMGKTSRFFPCFLATSEGYHPTIFVT